MLRTRLGLKPEKIGLATYLDPCYQWSRLSQKHNGVDASARACSTAKTLQPSTPIFTFKHHVLSSAKEQFNAREFMYCRAANNQGMMLTILEVVPDRE